MRAYGGVTRNCLRAAETVTKTPRARVRVRAPLALAGAVFQVGVCVMAGAIDGMEWRWKEKESIDLGGPPPLSHDIRTPRTQINMQTITRAGGDKVGEDYTPQDVIVDVMIEYTGPQFMDELSRLVRDATKGAGAVEEVADEDEDGGGGG